MIPFFILLAYGFTNILVYGKIFDKPRAWISNKSNFFKQLLECMMCCGTWVGFALSFFVWSPVLSFNINNDILNWHYGMFYPLAMFLDGMFASGSVWVIHTIQEYYENK